MSLVDIYNVKYDKQYNVLLMYSPQADDCFDIQPYNIKVVIRSPKTTRLILFESWYHDFDPTILDFVIFTPVKQTNMEGIKGLCLHVMSGYSYAHFNKIRKNL